MALQKTLIPVPMQTGLSQKVDSRSIQLGSQTSIINGEWTKQGALRKRPGNERSSIVPFGGSGAPILGCKQLLNANGTAAFTDGTTLFTLANKSWVPGDPISNAIGFRQGVATDAQNILTSDVAIGTSNTSTYQVVAWSTSGNAVYCSVIDIASGTHVLNATKVNVTTNIGSVKVICTANYAVFVYQDSTGLLLSISLDLNTLVFSAETSILGTAASLRTWDACPMQGVSDEWLLVANVGLYITIGLFDHNGVVINSSVINAIGNSSSATVRGMAITATGTPAGENVWVVYAGRNVANTDTWIVATAFKPDLTVQTASSFIIYNRTELGGVSYRIGVERVDSTTAFACWNQVGTTDETQWVRFTTSQVLTGIRGVGIGYQIASRPFQYNGLQYAMLVNYQTGNPGLGQPSGTAYILAELQSTGAGRASIPRPVTIIAPRIIVASSQISGMPLISGCVASPAGMYFTTGSTIRNASQRQGVDIISFNFGVQPLNSPYIPCPWQSATVGGTTYLAGGVPSEFDGYRDTEIGFLYPPTNVNALPSNTGGFMIGTTSTGGLVSYAYLIVYEWTDIQGHRKQSSPYSVQVSFSPTTSTGAAATVVTSVGQTAHITGLSGRGAGDVGGFLTISGASQPQNNGQFYIQAYVSATELVVLSTVISSSGELNQGSLTWVINEPITTGSVAFQIPMYCMQLEQQPGSNYKPEVTVGIYRTSSIAADQGTFFRLYSDNVQSSLLNAPNSAGFMTFTDTLSDATVVGPPNFGAIYTSGGVEPAVCPSSMTGLVVYGQRLIGIGDDRLTLWVSTQYDGSTQPYFVDDYVINITKGGYITALAVMDETLVIFMTSRIFILRGQGPNLTNSTNDWGAPQEVVTDVGCSSDWRSVVEFPKGVVFQYGAKLYILSRGLQVDYFSAGVEDYLAANPIVTSAVLVAIKDELRFTCRPTPTSDTGVVLVYNYVLNAWTQWQFSDGPVLSAASASAICVNDIYYWGTDAGAMYIEDSDSYLDNGYWIYYSVESAWVKSNGLQSWGRFWYMSAITEGFTPYDVTIQIATDYNATYSQTRSWTAQMIVDSFTTPLQEVAIQIRNQKSAAVRIKFSDGPPTNEAIGTGQGPNLLGFTLEYGAYPGGKGRRLPTAQKA